jgi:hypothetical protein
MIFKLMAQFPLTTEVASTLEQEIVEERSTRDCGECLYQDDEPLSNP